MKTFFYVSDCYQQIMLCSDLSIGMEGLGFHFTEDSGQPTLPNHLVTTLFFGISIFRFLSWLFFWVDVVQQILLLANLQVFNSPSVQFSLSIFTEFSVVFLFSLKALLYQAAFHNSWYTNANLLLLELCAYRESCEVLRSRWETHK